MADGSELRVDETGEPAGFVFKTISDPFVGRLSFIKVLSGYMEPSTELVNARTGKKERLGHIYVMMGKEPMDVKSAKAGDIVVVPKLSETKTGDTLSKSGDIEVDPRLYQFLSIPFVLWLKRRPMRTSLVPSWPVKLKSILLFSLRVMKKLTSRFSTLWEICRLMYCLIALKLKLGLKLS